MRSICRWWMMHELMMHINIQPAHLGLKHVIDGAGHELERLGEQIVQQAHEDGRVVAGQLAQVEVTKGAKQDLVLRQLGGCSLHPAGHVKGGLDGPQLPIIVPNWERKKWCKIL